VAEIPADVLMFRVCEEMSKSLLYGQPVIKICSNFLKDFRQKIIESFSAKFEVSDTTDNFFQLKKGLCEYAHPGCMSNVQDTSTISKCKACKLLMLDIERVTSWGIGRSNFGTSEHLYRVLDDICLTLAVRYPLKYRNQVLEVCADLLDEYGSDIVNTLQGALAKKHNNPQHRICTQVSNLCSSEEL